MTDVMIKAEGLGKSYLIGHKAERESYQALRDVIARTATGFARSALDILRGRQILMGDTIEEFWALRDVDFEIRRGEVVGIIGRNGAGKSTLLKVLSRITEPSEGQVTIRGRVASLLEVGSGFHPELTGRENIFLNGAILGMSRSEIRRKFDEIVAFAEVEQFLDTPVKRYSSGMHVRLAFSVAAHLEPEILVVDEVLAVGDAEFQRKCLGKMESAAGEGRTILFVSHNMTTILDLCQTGIHLSDGHVIGQGPIREIVDQYRVRTSGLVKVAGRAGLAGEISAGPISSVVVEALSSATISSGEPAVLNVSLREPLKGFSLYFDIFDSFGADIFRSHSRLLARDGPVQRVRCELPALPLLPGDYTFDVALFKDDKKLQHLTPAGKFEVFPPLEGLHNALKHSDTGGVYFPQKWICS